MELFYYFIDLFVSNLKFTYIDMTVNQNKNHLSQDFIFLNVYCSVTVIIPVSCRRNTLSLLHVSPHHSMLEDQLGSRAPSTPHFVGAPLDLEHKHFKTISDTF